MAWPSKSNRIILSRLALALAIVQIRPPSISNSPWSKLPFSSTYDAILAYSICFPWSILYSYYSIGLSISFFTTLTLLFDHSFCCQHNTTLLIDLYSKTILLQTNSNIDFKLGIPCQIHVKIKCGYNFKLCFFAMKKMILWFFLLDGYDLSKISI